MSCYSTNNFISVSGINHNNLINQLEDNLKSYLDNGFLNIGGFVNINIPTSGLSSIQYHRLQPVTVPGFTNSTVWQSFKKDWVWEQNINYNGTQPNSVTGIYINNVFYPAPSGSGNIAYNINYNLGRIEFASPVSASAVINASYSYKWCQVYKSSSSLWWKELQQSTLTSSLTQNNNGDFLLSSNHVVQLPCIVIEPISRTSMVPHQLGDTSFRIYQDIMLHIFTNNNTQKNDLIDIIRTQKHKTIKLYDTNKTRNIYGLKFNGSPIISGINYHQIIDQYFWKTCYFSDVQIIDMESLNFNLSWCTLRLTSEIIQ